MSVLHWGKPKIPQVRESHSVLNGNAALDGKRMRVCVVGSGTRFLSGISYYTHQLAESLGQRHDVSMILMRQLLPTRFYPGRARVGQRLSNLSYSQSLNVFDGVDWYLGPGFIRSILFLWREKPEVVVFQWWTGTVLHIYLLLAFFARMCGARIIIEFHEVLDTGEAALPLVPIYVRFVAPWLMRLASSFIIHSEFDRAQLQQKYTLGTRPVVVIPHGPYTQYRTENISESERPAVDTTCNLLFFGTIRPYKGLEDLITAFNSIPEEEIEGYHLTVVGETWEGWTLPANLIAQSRYRHRITFVNRYVHDAEVSRFFSTADAVVLPYHRSSASGPLHVAMSHGLPVVVTQVGGLSEAAADYTGAIFVPARDSDALRSALVQVKALQGQRFADPHSWNGTVTHYTTLFDKLGRKQDSMKEVVIP